MKNIRDLKVDIITPDGKYHIIGKCMITKKSIKTRFGIEIHETLKCKNLTIKKI